MNMKRGKWFFLIATSVAFAGSAAAAGGCSDDSKGSPGSPSTDKDTGTPGAPDQYVPDASTPDVAVTDAGRDTSQPDPCAVADSDPSPRVRLVNVLLPTNPGRLRGDGDAPAMRLLANGAAVPCLTFVSPEKGAASVSNYVKVPTGSVTFSAEEDATTVDAGTQALKLPPKELSLTPGMRLTIFAIGRPRSPDADKAQLLILEEKFASPKSNEVNFRFLNVDYGAVEDGFLTDGKQVDSLGFGKASADTGIAAPASTKSIAATSDTLVFGPTNQAPFTLPASTLSGGRNYFVVSVGEPSRWADDAHTHALLVIPAGDNTPATLIKRDPFVYFFHASPDAPPALEIKRGGKLLALDLKYAQTPTYADLPPSGATLQYTQAAGASVVLDNQATGTLDPGGIYFGGVIGFTGGAGAQALQSKYWKVQPTPGFTTNKATRTVVIHASPNAPAVDVGYWGKDNKEAKIDPFTPKFSNLAYGSASAPAGTNFDFPSSLNASRWLGVQAAGDTTTNRAAYGVMYEAWDVAVLMGDWESKDPAKAAQLVFMDLSGAKGNVNAFKLPKP